MQPFLKDILVIDFEFSQPDAYDADPLQVGAVLLDKETLSEKKSFSSYVKTDLSKASRAAITITGITEENMANAPSISEVGKTFFQTFGKDVILSAFVQNADRIMLRKLLSAAGIADTVYDYHILDIWPLAYVHLLKKGYNGKMRSEAIFEAFGLPPREHHDALTDCRMAAEVLRKTLEIEQ